ncbi:MAG: bifunctional phosphoribosylaminoimidazolecarboxamide formyltransferase/IMP cyclohydrolase, partial [Planctomycetota bacterium]
MPTIQPDPAAAATENAPLRRALISVSDKTGLVDFARRLAAAGVELVSTGGSAKAIADAGITVTDVAQMTGFPEMMGGRLKTLHPLVHGGILCRRDDSGDMAAAAEHGIAPIDLVVVNLYPFRETIAQPGVSLAEAIEKIDIGGPTLLRAAAKNHSFVAVACSPSQYGEVIAQVEATGGTSPDLRRKLAGAAFAHTAEYDRAIADYFADEVLSESFSDTSGDDSMPETLNVSLTKRASLRYGENPHQSAALYATDGAPAGSLVDAEQLNGKELSYNNLLDLDAALACARSLPVPGVAVLKHNNPCGAATAETIGEATHLAWEGDPLSAFGSILGFNVPVDAAAAESLAEPGKFVEAIVAPDFTPEALE